MRRGRVTFLAALVGLAVVLAAGSAVAASQGGEPAQLGAEPLAGEVQAAVVPVTEERGLLPFSGVDLILLAFAPVAFAVLGIGVLRLAPERR